MYTRRFLNCNSGVCFYLKTIKQIHSRSLTNTRQTTDQAKPHRSFRHNYSVQRQEDTHDVFNPTLGTPELPGEVNRGGGQRSASSRCSQSSQVSLFWCDSVRKMKQDGGRDTTTKIKAMAKQKYTEMSFNCDLFYSMSKLMEGQTDSVCPAAFTSFTSCHF